MTKRLFSPLHIAFALLLVALVAYAAPVELDRVERVMLGGAYVGSSATASTANKLTRTLAASQSIDFAGVTDVCEDSPTITVTGATVGDTCNVGTPATMPHANAWVTCYVSATNTVRVRLCAHGASGNPSAATYYVRVFSSQ